MSDETVEKTFQVTAPARLIVSNIRGSITIQPGQVDVIQVRAVKHGIFNDGRYTIDMAQEPDGSVRVETRSHEAIFGFSAHPPKVDYTFTVPQDIHLDASCISSTLIASGVSGVFKLKTVSGDIELADLSGPFKINAVSGNITGKRLSGPLEAEAVSGRVRMLESTFASAEASTVSGDLILQTPLSDGPYNFGSVSGNVRLLVPEDTHCNAELKTVSGSIRSSLPAISTRMGHGVKMTQIQGGGVAIRLKSVSGNLFFETEGIPAVTVPMDTPGTGMQGKPTPPVPPVPPAPPATSESSAESPTTPLSTAEILQRIERGEMTVDEAIKLMKNQP